MVTHEPRAATGGRALAPACAPTACASTAGRHALRPAAHPPADLVDGTSRHRPPDRLWVTDITQHPTGEGWLYAAAVVDGRRVVGWRRNEHLRAELVLGALDMAIGRRSPGTGLVPPSDHGAQYSSLAFGRRLKEAGIGLRGSVDDALDNTLAESCFAHLRTEVLDRRSWPTRQALRSATFLCVEGFWHRRRRHSSLGHLSPEGFER
jgi:putative transposase